MNIDNDATNFIHAWLGEDDHVSANGIVDEVIGRLDSFPQRPTRWLPARLPAMSPAVRVALATTAVVVFSALTVNVLSRAGFTGGPPPAASNAPSESASSEPSVAELTNILGLPPEGTAASDPTIGELVLRFESTGAPSTIYWLYADGRLIWSPFLSTPAGMGDAYTGLVERRLTTQGVEFLRSEVAASGLFAHDLLLLHEGNAPYLRIDLKSGDQLVRVTWAWSGIAEGSPVATAEQEVALEALKALFADPSSWPASAWDEDAETAYVPSSYVICLGVRPHGAPGGHWLGPTDPEPVLALLPQSARDLLRAGESTTDQEGMHADAGCTRLTTDNARALARAFEGAPGANRSNYPEPASRYWVAYKVDDPSGAWDPIWIQFGPGLPDGQLPGLGPVEEAAMGQEP